MTWSSQNGRCTDAAHLKYIKLKKAHEYGIKNEASRQ
jgi:hypothetical protein